MPNKSLGSLLLPALFLLGSSLPLVVVARERSSDDVRDTRPQSNRVGRRTGNPTPAPPQTYCGCSDCTDAFWNLDTPDGFSCGDRIAYLQSQVGGGLSETDACTEISQSFPTICGPACNPSKCDGQAPALCGCQDCTAQIWDELAGTFSCGQRIMYLMSEAGGSLSENLACFQISLAYPTVCGPGCDPAACDGRTSDCGCLDCTADILDTPSDGADGFTCGGRMTDLQEVQAFTEVDACTTISAQFPTTCGPSCNPFKCDERAPALCGCELCTLNVWNRQAGDFTCGDRIMYLQTPDGGTLSEADACERISNAYPVICSPGCNPSKCDGKAPALCGCDSCSVQIWDTPANGFTCGERIQFLRSPAGGSMGEIDACIAVSDQFPSICGPDCDVTKCDGVCQAEFKVADPSPAPAPALESTAPVFCFPEYASRERYLNAWDSYALEVKESTSSCGPNFNNWSRDTVSYDTTTKELTLEYKQVDGIWTASEVRVLNRETASFTYGTYSVYIKSVSVLTGDTLLSSKLPPNIVLGMFTWDSTALEEENREVDIEISQWGEPANEDVQFLIQPETVPGPHFLRDERFYSGGAFDTYDQGGHWYNFSWEPGEIRWWSDAGGGQTLTYSSAYADSRCVKDFLQCLPGNLEFRLNLWKMGPGDLQPDFEQPADSFSSHRVEVVISDFVYTPSDNQYVADGEICSKKCQCAPASECLNAVCTAM